MVISRGGRCGCNASQRVIRAIAPMIVPSNAENAGTLPEPGEEMITDAQRSAEPATMNIHRQPGHKIEAARSLPSQNQVVSRCWMCSTPKHSFTNATTALQRPLSANRPLRQSYKPPTDSMTKQHLFRLRYVVRCRTGRKSLENMKHMFYNKGTHSADRQHPHHHKR